MSRRQLPNRQHANRRVLAAALVVAGVVTVTPTAWTQFPVERRAVIANLGLLGVSSAAGVAHAETINGEEIVKAPKAPSDFSLDNYKKDNYGKAKKCASLMECEELGAENRLKEFGDPNKMTFEKTVSGARYKDYEVGDASKGVAAVGKTIGIRYRVMRSGKRSTDGLSGAASTIYSKGFGEDDGPKDALLRVKLGDGKFVKAMEEGLIGMNVNGTRRIQVRPEKGLGWKKAGQCAKNIGAIGVVAGLPMGGAQREEDCLNEDLLPQPDDYGEKRRFARRFDESLIVEIQLAEVK